MISFRVRQREKPEPHESDAGIPWYVTTLIVGLFSWGVYYLATAPQHRDMPMPETDMVAEASVDGGQIFSAKCAACHQADGAGLGGVFPPLAGSEWVKGDPTLAVRILLDGLVGEVEVSGVTYNGMMPAFGSQMTDAEVAAVVSYIRTSWGNQASPVTAEQVAAARSQSADRTTPLQGQQELEALRNQP